MKKLVSVFLSVILLIFSVLVSQATGLYSYDTDFNSAIALNRGTDGHSQEPLEETENEISDALGGELQVTWLDEGLHVTGDFCDGLAAVVNKDGYGYINTAGELVITLGSNYNAIFDFTGGLAVVYKNSKFGCIDTSGTLVLPYLRLDNQYRRQYTYSVIGWQVRDSRFIGKRNCSMYI